MKDTKTLPHARVPVATTVRKIGCVSYLNAKPLIHKLDAQSDLALRLDVPSRLLAMLESGDIDVALCPVIDYHRSCVPLQIIPAGGIGCHGPTLTVRLYSRVPFEQITHVYIDSDSHTSVALLQIVLAKQYGVSPTFTRYAADDGDNESPSHEAVLLIGDKVVTNHPSDRDYPHQLDLGQAWYEFTSLPFVFAVWMARADADLGDLPNTLRERRIKNAMEIDQIVTLYAPRHGWPVDLARQYLSDNLCYEIDEPQITAIRKFGELAHDLGVIDELQPLRLA